VASRFDNLTASQKLSIQKNIQADNTSAFLAVQLKFDSETIRLWTGTGTLALDSNTYLGAGNLLNVSAVEDDSELSSKGLDISLAGMDENIVNLALSENYQNRQVTVFMGFLSGNNEVASSFIFFRGRIMNMSISDGPSNNTVSIECENRLVDFARPSQLRYTKASQQNLFPGDKGLDFVQSLQEADINWGPSKASGGGSGGGGGSVGGNPIDAERSIRQE
jgi:hypothetical protein